MYARITHVAGDTIEVENKFTWSCPPPKGKREKKFNPSDEAVKKNNEMLSQAELRRTINHNFKADDLHVILTHGEFKPSQEETRKIIKEFNRCMRREYKKLELEYKYIRITGWIDKDIITDEPITNDILKHNEVAEHHHFIMNAIDYKLITKHWKHGRVWLFPLDEMADYTSLANYFFRHTNNNFRNEESPLKKRWSPSRNLKKPPPPIKKRMKARDWSETPKPKKGYQIVTDSIRMGVSEFTGYPYQFYRMVRIPERNLTRKRC